MKTILFFAAVIFCSVLYSQNVPTWQRLPNAPFDPNGKFEDLYLVNDSVGWLVGLTSTHNTGAIYKTYDSGESWIDQSFSLPSGSYLRCVGFINDSTGWCGNLNPHVNDVMYKTTDGGTNWFIDENVPDSSLSGACGIWILDESNVFACGTFAANAGLLKTTNSGKDWQYIDLKPYAAGAVDLHFFSPDTGFVVGLDTSKLKAVVLSTVDGGKTWEIKHTSVHTEEWAWKICFPTRNTGYVTLQTLNSDLYFLKTVDGGNTWVDLPFSAYTDFVPSGIGFVDELKGWQGTHPWGTEGGMVETTDGGLTWSVNNAAKNVNKFRIINDTLAYACGETVYKYTSETISNVNGSLPLVPKEFKLYQNFPNPFNPLTTILFTIPSEQYVQFEIFNVNGELIETLIDTRLKAGEYEVRFMGAKLPSGVYFYTLKAGDLTETKKMILMK